MLKTAEKKKIITDVTGNEKNTGDISAQIALLTSKILQLNDHLRINIHDTGAKRGLLCNVGQRKKMLRYLKANQPKKYEEILVKLGLRK